MTGLLIVLGPSVLLVLSSDAPASKSSVLVAISPTVHSSLNQAPFLS